MVVVLASVYSARLLDFSVFPTVLLMATLLRLALNIASTRVVLLEDTPEAPHRKGHRGLGEFVIGGNYAVGLIVFVILVIINFVVVTKGAGRVSEVTARFTLDAMPGKQMAIDADLNAGLLSHEDARIRREDIARESDFYGAMDGASVVRGDAVRVCSSQRSIFWVALCWHGAARVRPRGCRGAIHPSCYWRPPCGANTLSSVHRHGDHCYCVSLARTWGQVSSQLFASPKTLAVTAGVIGETRPGSRHANLVFLGLAGPLGYLAWRRSQEVAIELLPDGSAALSGAGKEAGRPPSATQKTRAGETLALPGQTYDASETPSELSWNDLEGVDVLSLEVGYRLIPLVERSQGGELASQIKGVRKKLSSELGFLVQPVHIRDNLELSPTNYRTTINGVPMATDEVQPDRELAINPGQVFGTIEGIPGKDPSFGLEAVWIEPQRRDEAQGLGYTVVDAGTVIATHLATVVQKYAHEIFAFEDAQALVDQLKESAPKLAEELSPKTLPMAVITRVFQNLLAEGVPLRDLRTIASTLLESGSTQQDPDGLTAAVRAALARQLGHVINGDAPTLPLIAWPRS